MGKRDLLSTISSLTCEGEDRKHMEQWSAAKKNHVWHFYRSLPALVLVWKQNLYSDCVNKWEGDTGLDNHLYIVAGDFIFSLNCGLLCDVWINVTYSYNVGPSVFIHPD